MRRAFTAITFTAIAFPVSRQGRGPRAVASLLPLLLLLVACGVPGQPPPRPASAPASGSGPGRPRVLATFTVLADMALEVACGRLEVQSITKPGAEIHSYEVTPSDLRRAQGTRLLLENGLGLEQWTRRFTDGLEGVTRVTLSEGVATLPIGGGGSRAR